MLFCDLRFGMEKQNEFLSEIEQDSGLIKRYTFGDLRSLVHQKNISWDKVFNFFVEALEAGVSENEIIVFDQYIGDFANQIFSTREEVGEVIEGFPKVKFVDFEEVMRVKEEHGYCLFHLVKHLRFDNGDLVDFCDSLKKMKNLTHLKFKTNEHQDGDTRYISTNQYGTAKFLSNSLYGLVYLDLTDCGFDYLGARELILSPFMGKVKFLNLSNNNFGASVINDIDKSEYCSSLTHLNFSGNKDGWKCKDAISRAEFVSKLDKMITPRFNF
jgi:putative methionine-R-sulfoxide reductase with GAF domain